MSFAMDLTETLPFAMIMKAYEHGKRRAVVKGTEVYIAIEVSFSRELIALRLRSKSLRNRLQAQA